LGNYFGLLPMLEGRMQVVKVAWIKTMSLSSAPVPGAAVPPPPFWTPADTDKVQALTSEVYDLILDARSIAKMNHVSPVMANAISDILERGYTMMEKLSWEISEKAIARMTGAPGAPPAPPEPDDVVDRLEEHIRDSEGGAL